MHEEDVFCRGHTVAVALECDSVLLRGLSCVSTENVASETSGFSEVEREFSESFSPPVFGRNEV